MTTHEAYHADRFQQHWRRFIEDPANHHARNTANKHADYLKTRFNYTARDIEVLKQQAAFASRNGAQS